MSHKLGPLCDVDPNTESIGCIVCGTNWVRETLLTKAAPALLGACEALVLTDRKRVGITVNPHALYTEAVRLARAALALAKETK